MESTSDIVTTVATIGISAVVLYLLAAGGRRLLGDGVEVRIVIGEQETTVTVQGTECFRTSSKVKHTPLDGRLPPRILGLHAVDESGAGARDEQVSEYDLAGLNQHTSKDVLDAFIVACTWRAREEATASATLGGLNVVVVFKLPEERQAQLLRELHTRKIGDATGARVSVEAAT